MDKYLPVLIVGAIIGIFTIAFVIPAIGLMFENPFFELLGGHILDSVIHGLRYGCESMSVSHTTTSFAANYVRSAKSFFNGDVREHLRVKRLNLSFDIIHTGIDRTKESRLLNRQEPERLFCLDVLVGSIHTELSIQRVDETITSLFEFATLQGTVKHLSVGHVNTPIVHSVKFLHLFCFTPFFL